MMRKYLSIALAGIIGIAVLAFIWSWITSPLIVTVTGVGEADIPATSTSVVMSISTTDSNSQLAIANLKAKVTDLKEIIRGAGVQSEDIIESPLSVVPRLSADQVSVLEYSASESLGAKNIAVAKMEQLIPSLYGAGATLVTQPTISSDNQKELEEEAQELALKDAQSQAKAIARKNFKFISKMIAMTQNTSAPTTAITGRSDNAPADAGASAGTFKITKTVTVSYKMW